MSGRSRQSGFITNSASSLRVSSSAIPALIAAAYPALRPSWTVRTGRSVMLSATATLPSLDALSATTTESRWTPSQVNERRQSRSTSALLKVTMTTATRAASFPRWLLSLVDPTGLTHASV